MPPRPQALQLPHLSRPTLPHQAQPTQFGRCLNRDFSVSTTSSARAERTGPGRILSQARRNMFRWLDGPGKQLKYARPGTTNYLGAYDKQGRFVRGLRAGRSDNDDAENDGEEEGNGRKGPDGEDNGKKVKSNLPPETQEDLRPFPLNPFFRSEPVLSEELRHEIYKRVVERGQSVREVSIALQVEMARVGAVVRLMTIEQEWIRKGHELARPYQSAVLSMVPTTSYNPSSSRIPRHESINDLPVHPATLPQIFHPTSESRHFTRADAGQVFFSGLLPADDRIPHPEMIAALKDRAAGLNAREVAEAQSARIAGMEAKRAQRHADKERALEKQTTVVAGRRWDFKFVDCSVDEAGKKGRSLTAAGWRYGFPHEDRKKGQIKIVTKIDD